MMNPICEFYVERTIVTKLFVEDLADRTAKYSQKRFIDIILLGPLGKTGENIFEFATKLESGKGLPDGVGLS